MTRQPGMFGTCVLTDVPANTRRWSRRAARRDCSSFSTVRTEFLFRRSWLSGRVLSRRSVFTRSPLRTLPLSDRDVDRYLTTKTPDANLIS
jgi:hypothetical protein